MMSDDAPFLEAIAASPDDDAPRLIYADWLSEQGDEIQAARGELIRTQIALESAAAWSFEFYALQATERALLAKHQREWEAPLAALGAWNVVFRRGFPYFCEISSTALVEHGTDLARVASTLRALRPRRQGKSLARALSHLLPMRIIVLDLGDNQLSDADATAICRSPWLPELEDLSLALNFFSGPAIVEILLAAGEASSLRRLCLLDNGLTAEAGRLIANVPILHRLESLDIRGNALRGALRPLLAACGAGRLQTLGMAVMHHDEAFATTLRDALPRSITSLDIGDNRLDEIDLTWLAGDYAAGRSFRRLSLARTLLGSGGLKTFIENYRGGPIERLQLAGNGLSDRDTVTLTEWPMIETVRSLDLSSNQFTNAGALTLANEPRLANLRELSLAHNRIGSPGVAALKASSHLAGLAKPVDVGQNTPPELYR